jgi:hypothetical protein
MTSARLDDAAHADARDRADRALIRPGKADHHAHIECFKRSFREEMLDAYVFEELGEHLRAPERWQGYGSFAASRGSLRARHATPSPEGGTHTSVPCRSSMLWPVATAMLKPLEPVSEAAKASVGGSSMSCAIAGASARVRNSIAPPRVADVAARL